MSKFPEELTEACERSEAICEGVSKLTAKCVASQRNSRELANHTGCLMSKLTTENRGAGNQIPI
jgi:hypothetical protein